MTRALRRALCCALTTYSVAIESSPAVANGRFPAAGQLVVDPAEASHIVVRTTFGLLQTFDSGVTWSWICEQAVSPDGFQDPEIIVTTGGRTAVGLADGLAVGDRDGCQWTRAPGLANIAVIDLVESRADPGVAYAAAAVQVDGAFNGLVAGTTDGLSWAAKGTLLPDAYPLTIEMAPSRPERLYLGADDGNLENGFIAVSDDGGMEWTIRSAPAGVDGVYVSAVDPDNPDRVYVRSFSPRHSLYVSEDGASTWTLIDDVSFPMTGFALSPDGQQIAVGGSGGLEILGRSGTAGGSTFAVTTTNPLPVSCLAWTMGGLYACADETSAGFSIGVSTDGAQTFSPLLHWADLRLLSCDSRSSASACSSLWCATATTIGASCAATTDAGSDAEDHTGRAPKNAGAGCACDEAGRSSSPSVVSIVVAALTVWRRARHRRAVPRS